MDPTAEEIQLWMDLMKANNTYYVTKGAIIGATAVAGGYILGNGGARLYYYMKDRQIGKKLKTAITNRK